MISGFAILVLQTQLFGNAIQDELEKIDNITISEENLSFSNENAFLDEKIELGNLIQKASVEELVYILHNPQKQAHIDFFLYMCADKLSVDQYIDFIFELSKAPSENISENTWEKILFPSFQNRGILEYNYRDPRVISSLISIKAILKKSPLIEIMNDIQQGISLKKSLERKFERYHDNFGILPIKKNVKYLQAIKLMGLSTAWYEIKELVEQAKKEDPEQFDKNKQFAALESHLVSLSVNYSFKEILQQSEFIFMKEASPESIDFRTEKGIALLNAIGNSKKILFQQICLEGEPEIREMYIDILYLTIFDSKDWGIFLSLLGNNDKNIRQYAYNKIKYLGDIDLDTPLDQVKIDSLVQKYQLFKDNTESQIKQ